jgi:hypothetical protein
MPAIERGLGLVDRVVRRHVARLETVGWCERMPAIHGDGMLVWLTGSGLDGVGLHELPALRAPERFSPRTAHTVRIAWAAADIERAGHRWIASREMALAPSRWGAQVGTERGGPAAASHLRRLATEIGLTAPQFITGESVMADEPPVPPVVIETVEEVSVAIEMAPGPASDLPRPSPDHVAPQHPIIGDP